ncbi:hypothetical protein [Chryseobacterium shigense]|uniref:Uncharacterized protein n=1 Tax=Chryseobacterium shigense TaxID=297244 RepID=A0A841N791_9FLAO|nr:hypothetical protein [Chryseobacterium shigense]MBB6372744.1 hypothetical protein [Chryseobacterium shigense]
MKTIFLGMLMFPGGFIFAQTGNFGINTDQPVAKFDIVSKDNSGSTKALKISNSNLNEKITVLSNGNIGINSASPGSQLNIDPGSTTKSALKINTISTTNGRQNADINYNIFSPLAADDSGNVFTQTDIRSNDNAITFDGSYTTSGATNKILCTVNSGSILGFTVYTPFFQGQNGVGVSKYATVTWSRGSGFIIGAKGHDFGNNNVNNLTLTGSGTNKLTFDVQNGDDLIFEITGGNLVYRQVDSNTGTGRSEPFNILKSFRSK